MKIKITLEFELDESKVRASALPGEEGNLEWNEYMDRTVSVESGESSSRSELDALAVDVLSSLRQKRKPVIGSSGSRPRLVSRRSK